MSNQIRLPPNIFNIYQLFERSKNINWKETPFKLYKQYDKVTIMLARNINNLNYYQVDFLINKKINPNTIMYYLKDVKYRDGFSPNCIKFKNIKTIDNNKWLEEEVYNNNINVYNCLLTQFQLIFYTNYDFSVTDISNVKIFNSYQVLDTRENYVLRFETVLSSLDIDQDIDINIYVTMITNILRAIYGHHKLDFDINKK